jgi:methyl-accepting chemotaxis protein
MRSLAARLSASLIIALVVLTAVALVGLHYSLHQLAVSFIAARLQHDSDNLLAGLRFENSLRLTLDGSRLGRIFQQPYSGHYFKISAGEQVLRSRSLWDTDLDPPVGVAPSGPFFLDGPDQQRLLTLSRTFSLQGRPVTLLISEDFTPLAASLRTLLVRLALVALVLLGVLILSQYVVVRRSLSPLRALRQDLQRLAQGEIRQLDAPAPAEIQPLVAEINHLLAAIEKRLHRSRNALGGAHPGGRAA